MALRGSLSLVRGVGGFLMGKVMTKREEGWHQESGQNSTFQRTAEVVAQLRLQKLRAGVLASKLLLRLSRLPIYFTHLGTLSYLTYCVPSLYLFPPSYTPYSLCCTPIYLYIWSRDLASLRLLLSRLLGVPVGSIG